MFYKYCIAVAAFCMFSSVQAAWQRLPGKAMDIGVGVNNSAWAIGNSGHTSKGYYIYKWNGTSWDRIDGRGTRIDVDPSGNPWIVNAKKEIYQRINGAWHKRPGAARDIGIGSDNSVWVINKRIYRWNGRSWNSFGGDANNVSVGSTPWVTNSSGSIYRLAY